MTDDNTPADAGTVDQGPLSMDDATKRISAIEADTPQPETAKEPEARQADANEQEGEQPTEPADEEDWISSETTGEDTPAAEDPDQSEEGRFVGKTAKVKLEDGTTTTVEELLKGNLRQSDYTRKTQETAAEKAQVRQAASALQQMQQALTQERELTQYIIQAHVPPEPDTSMMDTDPIGFMQAREHRQQWLNNARNFYASQQQAKQAEAQYSQQEQAQVVKLQVEKLLEAEPVLKDQKKAQKALADVQTVMRDEFGIQPDELGEVKDARYTRVLLAATKYVLAKKAPLSKPSAENKPAVQRPGRRVSGDEGASRVNETKLQSFKTNGGSIDEAAALIQSLSRG